jgi:hypothetical protein
LSNGASKVRRASTEPSRGSTTARRMSLALRPAGLARHQLGVVDPADIAGMRDAAELADSEARPEADFQHPVIAGTSSSGTAQAFRRRFDAR